MASSQLAARPIPAPAVAGLRASSSGSGGAGTRTSSNSGSYTSSTSTSGLRRASATSATSTKLGGHPTSSSSASQFDLQACIDILKKLQPQVSPVLPALFVTPPVEISNNNKRKLQESSASLSASPYTATESDPKRQRRDASPQRERDSRIPSSSISDASSIASSSGHRGSHLKRSDSSSSTSTSATSAYSSQAPAAANKTINNDDHISPLPNLPSPAALATETTAAAGTPLQPTQWTKERLRKIAATCREKGRALKHSGDKKMREYRPDATNQHIPVLALVEQVDAIVLYAYAFWCEDLAGGNVRSRQASNTSTDSAASSSSSSTVAGGGPGSPGWKMGCNQENWKSIFGLLAFVRGKAEKMAASPIPITASATLAKEGPRVMELIVAWLGMLEALILQHLTTNLSRNLHTQASRLLATSATALSPPGGDADSAGRHTPLSASGSSSTSDKTSSPPSDAFLQNFMKLQNDLEKIHAQWPSSQAVLLSSSPDDLTSTGRVSPKRSTDEDILSRVLRKGKMAYEIEPTKLDDIVIPTIPKLPENSQPVGPEDLFKDEENYYHFSWPIVLHHQNSVAHATCFGRALLSEISERLSLGYQAAQLE